MYCCYIVPWYQAQCGIDSFWIKRMATSSHLWQQGCTWHSSSRPLGRRWLNTIQITRTYPPLNMWLLLASNASNSCSMKVILWWKKLVTICLVYIFTIEGLWKYPCLLHIVSGNVLVHSFDIQSHYICGTFFFQLVIKEVGIVSIIIIFIFYQYCSSMWHICSDLMDYYLLGDGLGANVFGSTSSTVTQGGSIWFLCNQWGSKYLGYGCDNWWRTLWMLKWSLQGPLSE